MTSNQEVWTRAVVQKAHWENRKAANVLRSGLLEADAVSVWVPLADLQVDFKVGDVMVKGSVSDEVDASTFTMTDLKAKYPYTAVIKSVDRVDFGSLHMQHVRLGAS